MHFMKYDTLKSTENNIRIHHHRIEKEYTILANHGAENENLALDTRGLLWYILSRQSTFEIHTWHLETLYKGKNRGNGIKAIRRMLNELKAEGYLTYKKFKNKLGQWQHRYDIYPIPYSDFQKKFPHCLEGDAAEGDAAEGSILPITELPITDLPIRESNRDCGNVHNSLPISQSDNGSLVSASPTAAQASISSIEREDKTPDLNDPELCELLSIEPLYIKYLRPSVLCGWLKKYGGTLVLTNVKLLLQVLKKQKKPIANPEAWMEVALAKNYAEACDRIIENKRFAENLRKKHNLRSLKINKRYCQEMITKKDFYYTLPTETFKTSLINCFRNE